MRFLCLVDPKGFEPLTLCLQSRCSNRAELGAPLIFFSYSILITYSGQAKNIKEVYRLGLENLVKGETSQLKNKSPLPVIMITPIKIIKTPINL